MEPYKFWKDKLNCPRYVLAPMVDHSELPWRMLSREYGCHLAYTPMFHAANFASSKKYRQKYFSTCPEDRPLIVQFCGNNPETILDAAEHVVDFCDGIDINLGCPQEIARRGHYGAFLQDEWELIDKIVRRLVSTIGDRLAISCKIRRFESIDKTVDYAKMLERAGCTFLGIHGRTREQRGCRTGLADWNHIRAVKEAVSIPIIANGNIQSAKDAEECLRYTGADAVMTAEGNLYNPALFMNKHLPAWEVASNYLKYVKLYPIPPGMAKSHLFKLFHRCIAMEENVELRSRLGRSITLEQLEEVIGSFREKYITPVHANAQYDTDDKHDCDYQGRQTQVLDINTLPVPPYLTQAHYRYGSSDNQDTSNLPTNIDSKPVDQSDNDVREAHQKRIKLSS